MPVRGKGTLWMKFQITNKAEHLIGNPRYFPIVNALRVTD